jgi:hypothetical protein
MSADKAGPCDECGFSINHEIHAPPFIGLVEIGGAGELAARHQWKRAETPLSIEPTENEKRQTCAADLVGCLKMWDYTREEARDIFRRSLALVEKAETWKNPLSGAGVMPAPGKPGGSHA